MRPFIQSMILIAVIAALSLIIYFSWNFQRKVHYDWSYKSMVQQTIRDMVKPEALKGN